MLGIDAKRIALRLLTPKQRSPYEEVWHLWSVLVPRRSITGRLLWGRVLRRLNGDRWIYKRYIEIVHKTESFGSAEIVVGVRSGEDVEALRPFSIKNDATPLLSLKCAQKTAALAITGVLILLSADIERHRPQPVAPTVNCDHDEQCNLLDAMAPMPDSQVSEPDAKGHAVVAPQVSQPDIKKPLAVAPHQTLDANGNGLIVSFKTGARAHVGARYAKRFQAYIDDLENNYGARVLFMGGIRRGHCSSSSEHPCGKALDVCQLRRGVVDRRCHLPSPSVLAEVAASHGLFEGGRWCNSDYGHAQVDTTAPACGSRRVHIVRQHRAAPTTFANIPPPM